MGTELRKRAHTPPSLKQRFILKVAILCNHRGGSMKSTPHRHYRAWLCVHACQGNGGNDIAATVGLSAFTRVRIRISPHASRARARAYCIRIVLWVPFGTSEIRQQECGPLKSQRKVVRHDDAHRPRNHANQATFTLRNAKSRWFAHVAHHPHFAYLDDHG